ncbi:MAG: hypothetical protein AB8V23_04200 [Candidatus Midichloria sp.]|uniref:Uncharacterized protein n=1 Tax=Hyalomma marginatum TaxID=34627 RepID=A0A8S4BVC1_9ACAR|nr:hypothetical protein MHYMCMPASI_00714 [Hyalomma marginatum]CAG7594523.1 hypothetical protein MHYMCMPSP_00900 [Hyalomma marginatum]
MILLTQNNFTQLYSGFYINGFTSYPIGQPNNIAIGGDVNCDGFTDIVLSFPNSNL